LKTEQYRETSLDITTGRDEYAETLKRRFKERVTNLTGVSRPPFPGERQD